MFFGKVQFCAQLRFDLRITNVLLTSLLKNVRFMGSHIYFSADAQPVIDLETNKLLPQ